MDLIRGALLGQVPLLDMPARCRHLLDTAAGSALPVSMMKGATAYGRAALLSLACCLAHSPTHLLTHSLRPACTHKRTLAPSLLFSLSFSHPLTHSLTRSLTHSLTSQSVTCLRVPFLPHHTLKLPICTQSCLSGACLIEHIQSPSCSISTAALHSFHPVMNWPLPAQQEQQCVTHAGFHL